MSWTLPKENTVRADGLVAKTLLDLVAGEIFSIHPKARKFVLASVDPNKQPSGEIVANELLDGKTGSQFTLPFNDFQDREVFVWGEVSDEPEKQAEPSCKEFERVKAKRSTVLGTIVGISVDGLRVTALWDEIVQGKWITELAAQEVESLGEKAEGKALELAKEAKPLVRERQEAARKASEDRTKESVHEELVEQTSKRRDEVRQELDQQRQRIAASIAKRVVDANVQEFSRIVQAGILTITAGENNYEIDVVAEIIDGYFEHILNKVSSFTSDYELRIPVAAEVMNILSDLMLDQYMLTREGYVRKRDGKWGVYSKKGKLLGTHGTKKKALRQLRAVEWRKRQGVAQAE